MKNLIDVYEKLRVDDISFNTFPIDGTLDDMIEFLKDNNFIIIEEDYAHALSTARKLINTIKSNEIDTTLYGLYVNRLL